MWEINLSDQITTAFLSFLLGFVFCIFYDLIKSIRKNGFNSFWQVFFGDVFFFCICAFAFFIFLISRTNGEIRAYVLFSTAVGFLIFRITFSKFSLWLFTFASKNIKLCFMTVFMILDLFFDFVYEFLKKNILKSIKFLKNSLKTLKKLLKNR